MSVVYQTNTTYARTARSKADSVALWYLGLMVFKVELQYGPMTYWEISYQYPSFHAGDITLYIE